MIIVKYIIQNYRKIYIFPFWFILYVCSLIYGFIIIYLRKRGYKHTYSDVFIINVGNITVGGTGKTPVVQYLALLFNKKYLAVILRGYKGKSIHKKGDKSKLASDIFDII